jgi:hypothetical protein
MQKPRNDRTLGVTRFCWALEQHRRTDAGRVRTPAEMVAWFFPRRDGDVEDRLFVHVPREVRGPVISGWGIRGPKSAARDDDTRVRNVVRDAFDAGDLNDVMFEQGVTPEILVEWAPLPDWWQFWRTGKLTGVAIQFGLAAGREMGLFDDAWFLQNLEGRGGRLHGTDAICDTLPKDQIVTWVRNIHASGDGSPAGLVAALGWETILTKTSQDALLFALDALAKRVGLVTPQAQPISSFPAAMTDPPSSAEEGNIEVRPFESAWPETIDGEH